MQNAEKNKYRKSNRKLLRLVFSLLTATMMLAVSSAAQTQQLPIGDYLALLDPTAAQSWIDPSGSGNLLVIDAYGKLNTSSNLNLNTTVTGKYMVSNLADGTQKVTVHFHTRNAVCWGFNSDLQIAFGYRLQGVVNQLGPAALGTATVRIEYAPQPAGQFDPGGALENFFATIRCEGLLRAGSGFAEGTPGFAQTTQTGLYNTGVPAGCPPEQDGNCFPAEKIQFKPLLDE